jgi:NAD(P)-dependent dehydrogenase (short-subunit alcohol dehydrogenase family)
MSDRFSLSGRVALVTGASRGLGLAMADALADHGALVVINGRDQSSLDDAVRQISSGGRRIATAAFDVSDPQSSRTAIDSIARAHGRLDILVNNAGVAHVGTIERTSEADLDRLYQVNVKGVFLGARAAVPIMLRQGGGVILNMASIASLVGVPERFAYSMSKGAVLTMTMSIAIDYVKQNIRCNCICPARIHTPFVDQYVARHYAGREQEVLQQLSAYQPIGRMGTSEEVAFLALYLCSDEASFVTGQAYPIDGGVLVA